MTSPSFIQSLRTWIAATRSPEAPADEQQQHVVRLLPITTAADQKARWDEPQNWCRQHVDHTQGHLWSRRMDRSTGQPVFSFSDPATGVEFALRFR